MRASKCLVGIILLFSFPVFGQCDISGVWKHSTKNAYLEVDLIAQTIRVKTHHENEAANGLTVIKNLLANTDVANLWSAVMFHGEKQRFVPVEITSQNCKKLIVKDSGSVVLTLIKE